MQIGNLGIFKNLVYGASIGFSVSLVLNLILLWAVNEYHYVDEWPKLFYGGGATGIMLFMLAQWFHDKNEFYRLNLWIGILMIMITGFAGSIIPIFVVGPLAILFSILGVLEFIDYLFNLLGGFCMGGISVGLAAGFFNHLQKSSNQI